ncbi:CotG/ExsB N-terminal domain-containing protein [Bacillus cereus]|uniref:CotG/ExsB N-terminal domain-containing protein n=1 Tax=Bacillus cereus TaxID=1396 RepID=UPI0039816094
MQRDIQMAVEELKSAGMEDFLHQGLCQFDCDEDCSSRENCKCPKIKCTRVKKWTFVKKRIREKRCILVTKRIRLKKCISVTKYIRYDKKCYWTRKCICEKNVTFPHCNHHPAKCPDNPPCDDE